ncbi:MAG: hypothetical protein E6J90_13655 [Deltaproteobacteria bacterium]|nr:MAG: hypothetical protein E6J90_13655 [Deltaproteobacteria bacterium]
MRVHATCRRVRGRPGRHGTGARWHRRCCTSTHEAHPVRRVPRPHPGARRSAAERAARCQRGPRGCLAAPAHRQRARPADQRGARAPVWRLAMSVTHSLARAALVTAITGAAAPALAGPDFVADDRANPLAASDARSELEPMEDIVFPLDTATPGSTALDQIAAVVRWLDVHPGYRVVVEGHTDSTGAASYNAALGTRRAVLVANRGDVRDRHAAAEADLG